MSGHSVWQFLTNQLKMGDWCNRKQTTNDRFLLAATSSASPPGGRLLLAAHAGILHLIITVLFSEKYDCLSGHKCPQAISENNQINTENIGGIQSAAMAIR